MKQGIITKTCAVAAALAMGVSLAACGGGSSADSDKGHVYFMNNKSEVVDQYKQLAEMYTEKTGVQVDVQTGASGTYDATMSSELAKSNAPTMFNAAFNTKQFWNGRAADLQEQAGGPPMNPIEMGSKDWDEICAKLAQDPELTVAFTAVYPDGWNGKNVTDAIAEYEKTLITPNSRFDKWLKGDDKALTAQEIEGYQRFKMYRCSSCHVGKSVGGQSFEYMDLKKAYFEDRGNPLGSDGFTGKAEDLHRFKVPNLRNVELTAPYLHDGTVTTLDEAVRIMGVYLSGMDIPKGDRDLIVGFLRTLTGEWNGKPLAGEAVKN